MFTQTASPDGVSRRPHRSDATLRRPAQISFIIHRRSRHLLPVDHLFMPLALNHSSERLNQFKGKIVGHPILLRAFQQVMDLIEEPADVEVAAVIGPTGAGKSTLVERVKHGVLQQHLAAMQADVGLVPVIAVDAPAPELGNFNWRDMYLRILVELKEPACDWQLGLKEKASGKPGVSRLASLNHMELLVQLREFLHLPGRHIGSHIVSQNALVGGTAHPEAWAA